MSEGEIDFSAIAADLTKLKADFEAFKTDGVKSLHDAGLEAKVAAIIAWIEKAAGETVA
ncbi:MAG: hypothetical protein P4M15_08620 [Alphaproteobacteria bacterium]|nr:hypothetical protein [Alphaproteobacteria bacterium]